MLFVAPTPNGVERAVVFETVSPFPFVYVIVNPVAPPRTAADVAAVVIVATKEIRHMPMAGVLATSDDAESAAACAVFIDVNRIGAKPCLVVVLPPYTVATPPLLTVNFDVPPVVPACKSSSLLLVPFKLVSMTFTRMPV